MTSDTGKLAAELLHLRDSELRKGDPVALPLTMASMYHLPGAPEGYNQYGRFSNPTWQAVEAALAHLESAPTLIFPSGMAAIAAVFYSVLKSGDRILLPSDGYYTTRMLADRFLRPIGVEANYRSTSAMLDEGFEGYRLVLLETPSNPGLEICDIRQASLQARNAGALLIVDNTTMTALAQRPLDLGADLVVASDTKAPNGHSDVLFGHVSSQQAELMDRLRDWRKISGCIPGPFEAWLVHRGLETLEMRIERMCSTADLLAPRLQAHQAIKDIRFPGLKSHPAHELAKAQMRHSGFLIGLTFSSEASAESFIAACPYIQPSTSFGGIHTSAERRARWGDAVSPAFVRLSIGCEPAEELWRSIASSLDDLIG